MLGSRPRRRPGRVAEDAGIREVRLLRCILMKHPVSGVTGTKMMADLNGDDVVATVAR